MLERMRNVDRQLFERVLEAHRAGDSMAAARYAAEVAGLRRLAKALITVKNVLHVVVPQIEKLYITRDPEKAAELAMLLEELRRHLGGCDPELLTALTEAAEGLREIAGTVLGEDRRRAEEAARQLVEDAAKAAEEQMLESFPPLPSGGLRND